MDDLISRQAAIIQLSHNSRRGDDEWEMAVRSDMQIIRELPSAEPQIIRCKDCRYYKQFGKSEWGDCLALSRICKLIDFCSWGAKQILSEADNDTAYGGLMSAT